jgi:hypothetical protein
MRLVWGPDPGFGLAIERRSPSVAAFSDFNFTTILRPQTGV